MVHSMDHIRLPANLGIHNSLLYHFRDIWRQNILTLKSQLGITHPASLCTICITV